MPSKHATGLLLTALIVAGCDGATGPHPTHDRQAGAAETAAEPAAKSPLDGPDSHARPARRAVIVGIDDYAAGRVSPTNPRSGCRPEESWSNLKGAVSDARAFRDILTGRYGFAPEDVRLLLDQDATRDAILGAVEETLIAPSRDGDHAAFFFFGHGSQMFNSKSEEIDRLDETLVPADSWRGAPDLRDKELRRIFNRVLDRGAALTVLLDSCHSGSGLRGVALTPRRIEPDRCDAADGGDPGPAPEERGALILSAARDEELSFEVWETQWQRHHGAFSLAMLRALRMSSPGEPAAEVFRRAEAVLRTLLPRQEAVIAGGEPARSSPLFGEPRARRAGSSVAAALGVDAEGRVLLNGGWIHGLAEASELEGLDRREGEPPVRLRVVALEGLARSRAEVLEAPERSAPPRVEAGGLFALTGWSSPPGPPLPVWVPTGSGSANRWALRLLRAAADAGIAFSDDPTEPPEPSHQVSWSQGQWHLATPDAEVMELGADPEIAKLIDFLRDAPPPVRLQVQLAVPSALEDGLGLADGGLKVEAAEKPDRAMYVLSVRSGPVGGLEAAWVLRGIDPAAAVSPLPVRSRWVDFNPARPESVTDAAQALTADAAGLARAYSWLQLESPRSEEFAYGLSLQGSGEFEGEEASGVLVEGRRYGLALKAVGDLSAPVERRFVYVFLIDSAGRCQLLYPVDSRGDIENLLPLESTPPYPAEIVLKPHPILEVVEPLGLDSYYLLATRERIHNPWVLNCAGVRGQIRGLSGLEALLLNTGSATRSSRPLYTPAPWSLQRLELRSIAPGS